MRRVIDYKIIVDRYSSDLVTRVKQYLDNGWYLQGPAQISNETSNQNNKFAQTIVKYEAKEKYTKI